MASIKRLKSVAHSIIHHAMSITSLLHLDGWLYYRCVKNKCPAFQLDLIRGNSNLLEEDGSITIFQEMPKMFKALLHNESWNIEKLRKASIAMYFHIGNPPSRSKWHKGVGAPYAGIAEIETHEGKKIVAEIQGNLCDFLIKKGQSKVNVCH